MFNKNSKASIERRDFTRMAEDQMETYTVVIRDEFVSKIIFKHSKSLMPVETNFMIKRK